MKACCYFIYTYFVQKFTKETSLIFTIGIENYMFLFIFENCYKCFSFIFFRLPNSNIKKHFILKKYQLCFQIKQHFHINHMPGFNNQINH